MELPTLSKQQVETICAVAEEAARKYILSKVPMQKIHDFDITVETEGLKPVTVSVDVKLRLSPFLKNHDTDKLVKEAVKKAFEAIDDHLWGSACLNKQKKS